MYSSVLIYHPPTIAPTLISWTCLWKRCWRWTRTGTEQPPKPERRRIMLASKAYKEAKGPDGTLGFAVGWRPSVAAPVSRLSSSSSLPSCCPAATRRFASIPSRYLLLTHVLSHDALHWRVVRPSEESSTHVHTSSASLDEVYTPPRLPLLLWHRCPSHHDRS